MHNAWVYPIIMITATAVCGIMLRRSQERLPLSAAQKFGIGLGAFIGAMVGSKLPFLFSDLEGLISGTAWLSHGKTIMCGIVGGYFGVEIAKWSLDVRVKTGDTFALPVAVAVAIGRVACFFGGCCYGRPTSLPWGVSFSTATQDPDIPRHPTQLYEASFHLTMAVILVWLARRGQMRGQLVKFYIVTYLFYRFATEFIRPEEKLWLGLTGYQWAAIAMLPLFVALWIRDERQFHRDVPVASELERTGG